MSPNVSAAQLLRDLRKSQGRSLRLTAEELGMAPSYLSRLERGERNVTPEVRERLAAYYGLGSDELKLAEGHLPDDVVQILRDHPDEIRRLRAKYSSHSGAAE